MMRPIFVFLLPLAAVAVLCVAAWVALHHYQPAIPEFIHYLLAEYPAVTGSWLMLSVVGIDYAVVAARDTLGYRNVGAKAQTHWRLRGGGK